jgi:hypothetical protein
MAVAAQDNEEIRVALQFRLFPNSTGFLLQLSGSLEHCLLYFGLH